MVPRVYHHLRMARFTLTIHTGLGLPPWARPLIKGHFDAADRDDALQIAKRFFSQRPEEAPGRIDRAELYDGDGAMFWEGRNPNA
jgi:hypothetical protein